MVKPCKVTYGGKEYSIEDYLGILHDGLLDQMVKDGIIDDSNFVKKAESVERTEIAPASLKKKSVIVENSLSEILNGKVFYEVVRGNDLTDEQSSELAKDLAESTNLPKKQFSTKDKISNDFDYDTEIDVKPIDRPIKQGKSKTESISQIVSKDELRPNMGGIFRDAENKKLVATDAMKMVVIDDSTISKTEIIDPKTNKVIDAKYPQYEVVIPKDNPIKRKVNVNEWLSQLNGLVETKKFFDKAIAVRIKIGEQEFVFDSELLRDVFNVMAEQGVTDVELQLSQPNRALVIESNKGVMGLVMPFMLSEEYRGGLKTLHQSEMTIAEKNGMVQTEIDYLERRKKDRQNSLKDAEREFKESKGKDGDFSIRYEKEKIAEIDAEIAEKKSELIDNPIQEAQDLETVKESINNGEITTEQATEYISKPTKRSRKVEQSIENIESKADSEIEGEVEESIQIANGLIVEKSTRTLAEIEKDQKQLIAKYHDALKEAGIYESAMNNKANPAQVEKIKNRFKDEVDRLKAEKESVLPKAETKLTKIEEAQQEVDTAVKDLLDFVKKSRGTATSFANVGEFGAKMAKVFIAYAKMGIVELKDVIAKLREDTNDNFVDENIDAIQDAWNEANGKSKKTLSDFKDVAEKIQAQEEKERLGGKAKRMTPQRLLASSEYSDEFKQAIGEDIIYYSVLPKRVTEQEAQAIIDLKGNENAEIAIMDMNNSIPMAVRNKIAQKLIDNYEAEGNIEKAVDIFAKITEKITDSAQGLSSLSTWPRLSPASAVYMAKQSIKKQRDKRAANSKNTTDKIDKELKKVNKESIQEALENIKNIVERNSLPNAGATVTELPAGYGQNNKVFTRDKYLAAKKKLRGTIFSFAGGVPIEELVDIAGYHIEATGKDFNKFTRRMKADLGNKIKPYLKDIYAKTRKQLIDSGYDKDLFLSDEDVDAQIAEQEGSVFLEKLKKAIEKKDEKAAKAAIAKLQEISKEDGVWGQYKQSAANRLKNVVVTNIQKDISENPSLEQFTDSLVKNMRLKMAELLPEVTKKKAIQRPDIEVIGDAFKNFEKYKEVWEQTQNEFQEKYQDFPEILEAIDAYFGEILDKPFSDKLLTRSINKGLKEMGVVVNDIVTKHYTVVDNTKQTLVDKLINDAGLTGAEAQTLAKAIEKEFDRIATEKKSKILAKIFSRKERKKPEVRSMESDIIRMTNLGAFRSDDIVQLYGDKMGWPKLTEANIKEIERLATIVQKTEDPIKKRKAVEDLLAYQANIKGVSVLDVATAIWYANILSGYNTQFVNFGSNAINTALLYGGVIAQNPRDAKFITKGLINGIKRGFLEGKEVLRTGYSPIKGKAEIPSLLERANFKDAIKGLPLPFVKSLDYASKLKYVRRIMVAADVIFFEGLKEMRAYQIAAIQAANEGKEKPTINQLNRAIELVGSSDEQYQAAREKAQLEYEQEVDAINSKELSEKNKKAALNQAEIDRRRRIYDLIEQNRSFNIIDESAEYAAEGTYNYPPKGGLGLAANAINTMVSGVPVLRYAIPFTNIIANVANETINYTPLAFARLKKGGFTDFRREALTQQQRTDLLYKGIIGTTLMAATFALTQIKGDDDEPILEITANGTGDYVKNATLQETGWQPYSIRFKLPNGEYSGWISYQYSPLIAGLGYIGNINDMMKYGDADEETIISLMSKSAGMTTSTFFQSTFLDGLGDLLSTVLDSRNIQKQQSIVEKLLGAGAGAVKALLIPNLFNQTSQAVQKITGEYKKETTKNVTGKFLQDIPYARDMFFDKINILGDPISPDTDKFLSFGKPNKAIELLVKNKQVFGPISREGEKIYDIVKDKERALTDEEFFTFSKEKGQYIKKELLDNYDDYSKMSEKEFKKEMTKIKKDATEKARESIGKISPDIEIMTIDNIEYKLTPDKVAERKDYIQEYIDDKEDSRSFERKIEKLIEKGSIKDTPSEIKKILMSDAKEYATKKMKKDYEDNPEELGAVKD